MRVNFILFALKTKSPSLNTKNVCFLVATAATTVIFKYCSEQRHRYPKNVHKNYMSSALIFVS